MVDVKELIKYSESVRRGYFECMSKLPWKEFVKNREASFHSMRNIFVHTLNAVDYWLDFLQNETLHSKKEYDEYKTFEQVKAYMEHVEKRTRDYLEPLSAAGLRKVYTITGENNKQAKVTAEDVIIHIFEEEVHHRGELIALLWQMGVAPPDMGWKGL